MNKFEKYIRDKLDKIYNDYDFNSKVFDVIEEIFEYYEVEHRCRNCVRFKKVKGEKYGECSLGIAEFITDYGYTTGVSPKFSCRKFKKRS